MHRGPVEVPLMHFYPRPPRGGRRTDGRIGMYVEISIHALREEGDGGSDFPVLVHLIFLSTPSARRATLCGLLCPLSLFISIHALREEGDVVQLLVHQFRLISIHALREEGDSCGAMQAG